MCRFKAVFRPLYDNDHLPHRLIDAGNPRFHRGQNPAPSHADVDLGIYAEHFVIRFMFPRVAMDAIFQYLGAIMPMTFYLTIIRGIMLKG